MRYEKFELHDSTGCIYSSRTIGAIKKFIKKNNIDTHNEHNVVCLYKDFNDENYNIKYHLSDFMNLTGYKNAPVKQKEFSRDYRNSRYVNVGLKD